MAVNWKLIRDRRRGFIYLTGENTKPSRSISSWCTTCGTNTPHTITNGCLCCKEDKEAEEYEVLNKPQPETMLEVFIHGCVANRRL